MHDEVFVEYNKNLEIHGVPGSAAEMHARFAGLKFIGDKENNESEGLENLAGDIQSTLRDVTEVLKGFSNFFGNVFDEDNEIVSFEFGEGVVIEESDFCITVPDDFLQLMEYSEKQMSSMYEDSRF